MQIESKRINCEIYDSEINLIYTDSIDMKIVLDKYKELRVIFDDEDILYAYTAKALKKKRGSKNLCTKAIYIIFGNSEVGPLTTGIVAHEAFHASSIILRDKGYKQDYDNEEPQAYLIEYITNHCVNFLKSHGVKL